MIGLYRLLPAAFPALLVGCQSYHSTPLIPEEILREIERARDLPGVQPRPEGATVEAPGFDQLAGWMLEGSPTLELARTNAAAAGALAEIATPLPNPTLGVGPLYGLDLEPNAPNPLVPFVEFGFSIPLSGRRGYQDEVNELLAEEARTEVVVAHRHAYLRLRELFAARILTHQQLQAQTEILESARRSEAVTRQLVGAGAASALDVGLMQLEVTDGEKGLLDIRERLVDLEAALAALIGIAARHLSAPIADLEQLPAIVLPELDAAKRLLLENHHTLSVLRARYAVAEKQLRLEIAKQYPDLTIGAAYSGDPGDTKKVLGLTLGINLPLFDRNQRGIAIAEQQRERIRTEYETTLNVALASLDGLLARRAILEERAELLREVALPRAASNVDVAIQSIRAGELDALRVLEVERRLRTLRIEALQAKANLRTNDSRIEQLIGWPLEELPEESGAPDPPDHQDR